MFACLGVDGCVNVCVYMCVYSCVNAVDGFLLV